MKTGPKGKYLFGLCKVGEKGQIVIPKEARDIFGINPGDYIVCLGDVKKGLALIKADGFQEITDDLLNRGDSDESNWNNKSYEKI